MKFGTGSWRDVIVARRTRKSSASSDAPAMVSLRELARWQIPSVQIVLQSNRAVIDGHGRGSCRRMLCLKRVIRDRVEPASSPAASAMPPIVLQKSKSNDAKNLAKVDF